MRRLIRIGYMSSYDAHKVRPLGKPEISTGHTRHTWLTGGVMEGMKSYGWGIIGMDGFVKTSRLWSSSEFAEISAKVLDEDRPEMAPHKAVELFYKEEQS